MLLEQATPGNVSRALFEINAFEWRDALNRWRAKAQGAFREAPIRVEFGAITSSGTFALSQKEFL
jgi:hypothetical protein